MYQCRVCFIENRVVTGTPPKMTSQETGDFPAVTSQGNVRHKKPRLRHARTPGGISDTNEVCNVLKDITVLRFFLDRIRKGGGVPHQHHGKQKKAARRSARGHEVAAWIRRGGVARKGGVVRRGGVVRSGDVVRDGVIRSDTAWSEATA